MARKPPRSHFSVNNLDGVGLVVEAGSGLHAGPLWLLAEAIDAGWLVRVLPDWSAPTCPVHALFAPGPYEPAKIRRFVDLTAAPI